jgi:cytochrome c oxidase subunit II
MRFTSLRNSALAAIALLATGTAQAQAVVGRPEPGGIGLQPAGTDVMVAVTEFHNLLLVIITAITLFVMALLLWVMVRYNKRANPVPRKFSHNTAVEIAWTVLPVLVLVAIAFRSFPLLYQQDVMPNVAESEIVDVKVYGRQWFWSYIYGSGDDVVEYDSNMIPREMLKPGMVNQLSVDNPMVVPAGKYIRVSVSASDVIHSFAMPAAGAKVDAIPGRLNQIWFKFDNPGVYFGQCSELCGVRHAYMPIELRVLPQEQFDVWLQRAATSMTDARAYLDQVQPLAAPQVASAN